MYIDESDRVTIKAILGSVTRSSLKIIDPELTKLVQDVLDVFTTDGDRARVDVMKARLAEGRSLNQAHPTRKLGQPMKRFAATVAVTLAALTMTALPAQAAGPIVVPYPHHRPTACQMALAHHHLKWARLFCGVRPGPDRAPVDVRAPRHPAPPEHPVKS